METVGSTKAKSSKTRRIVLWVLAILVTVLGSAALYLYNNYSRLLSDALMKAFDSSLFSDVYELKFEKLGVNLVTGNIQVYNVEIKPREKPLIDYPYINSSFELHTQKLLLLNVDISTLIQSQILRLDKIEILEPNIELKLSGKKYILFPFSDSTAVTSKEVVKKRPIESYRLKEFALVNATFHALNAEKEREFTVNKLSIKLTDLGIDQKPGRDVLTNKHADLSIGDITWRMQKGAVQFISIKDYNLQLDTLNLLNNRDTTIFHFENFTTGLKELDMQTGDSLFHLTMQSFKLSYRDKAITLKGINFKPNMSDAAMQRRFIYRAPVFSGSVGSVKLVQLDFDSLVYGNKILIEELGIDKAAVTIFTDQTKPVNPKKFPGYLGQLIGKIPVPLQIKTLHGTNMSLINRERKPDGGLGQVHIQRMTVHGKNITTFPTRDLLSVNADAYIENKAHVSLALGFNYNVQQYSINAHVSPFNIPDLNPVISSYTPGNVRKGQLDELTLTANVGKTSSTGTMKFLYHDLQLDLDLKDQAKWKSDFLTSVGNALLSSSNPPSANKPPRVVQFKVDRDMNKGFVNIMIKSLLAGFKETMIMSKENRKAYQEDKKLFRKKNKNK
ncbi:MAG TPA: hypothetical protein VK166_20365 [Chitinophagaceae bacterium]|nr:hypothetical protein [Chitinophagaceae bacterium]